MKTVLVKNKNFNSINAENSLSVGDLMAPCYYINFTFFYDYVIDEATLESALSKTLERYPELSGRLAIDQKQLKLTNEGVPLRHLDTSKFSLQDLKLNKFSYEFISEHFKQNVEGYSEVPMIVTSQKLAASSGMVLQFDVFHTVVDTSACYLLIADFCSMVKSGSYHFEEVEQGVRCKYFSPSGNPPRYPHHEVVPFDQPLILQFPPQSPSETTTLYITKDKLQQLKKDVYDSGLEIKGRTLREIECKPSTNDCMISMLHKAYVETLPSTEEISDETSYALGIAVNLRKIRIPPAAKTFFGNMLTSSVTPFSKGSVLKSSVFDMAVEVRRGIGMLSEEYIQSCIDKLDQLKFYQHYVILNPTTLILTNWNSNEWDWFRASDIGGGKPVKFSRLGFYDRAGAILPSSREGDLEVIFAVLREQMADFKKHPHIQKYFQFDD
ncbi:uncharacterized protein LOC142349495 [Convolutriloba macropyga]|uniref:uncharacterized protein LOC142349495 n=1 Tax=Convolutriloba macropyga TaxID=536237 RepID=UPI003F51E1B1